MARRSTNRKAVRRAERTQEAAEIERRLAPLKKQLAGQDLIDGMVGALKDHQERQGGRGSAPRCSVRRHVGGGRRGPEGRTWARIRGWCSRGRRSGRPGSGAGWRP